MGVQGDPGLDMGNHLILRSEVGVGILVPDILQIPVRQPLPNPKSEGLSLLKPRLSG